MRSVELFAGCGGFAYGIAKAGFTHALVVENDPFASATLLSNKERGVRHFASWAVDSRDAREVDYASLANTIDLVSGGPPCQPFSIGGKHKGPSDHRNMWPEALRAVRVLRPKAFVFENVRGLLRPAFEPYLTFLRLQLTWPELEFTGGGWERSRDELQHLQRSGERPSYHVVIRGINAADYGAPQKRHRAIILGVRADVAQTITFPEPSHSQEALVWSQRVTGEYWERHEIARRARPAMSEADGFVLTRLRQQETPPQGKTWSTVRDAIGDLPTPTSRTEHPVNHRLHPGARLYPRHTGSRWDEPAKALKAGAHGVPGGENILVGRNGSVRYFTLREMARLQGLPDDFAIDGTWKNPIRQLGNAVPVQVGFAFGKAIQGMIDLPKPAEAAKTRRPQAR